MVSSVKKQADRHLMCEKRRRQDLQEELETYQRVCGQQKAVIVEMETLLINHNISVPDSVKNLKVFHP